VISRTCCVGSSQKINWSWLDIDFLIVHGPSGIIWFQSMATNRLRIRPVILSQSNAVGCPQSFICNSSLKRFLMIHR
jgi:hypothetical protein